MKESHLKTKLLKDLRADGWYANKYGSVGGAGIPDIIAFKRDTFLALELKQANSHKEAISKVTDIQHYHRKLILKARGWFMIVASTTKHDILTISYNPENGEDPVPEYLDYSDYRAFVGVLCGKFNIMSPDRTQQ